MSTPAGPGDENAFDTRSTNPGETPPSRKLSNNNVLTPYTNTLKMPLTNSGQLSKTTEFMVSLSISLYEFLGGRESWVLFSLFPDQTIFLLGNGLNFFPLFCFADT